MHKFYFCTKPTSQNIKQNYKCPIFFQILNILIHTQTQGKRGEGFKKTNSGVYLKGPYKCPIG